MIISKKNIKTEKEAIKLIAKKVDCQSDQLVLGEGTFSEGSLTRPVMIFWDEDYFIGDFLFTEDKKAKYYYYIIFDSDRYQIATEAVKKNNFTNND